MQGGSSKVNNPERGKKMYYGEERLSYMDRAVDLAQPDYKRFRLGKIAKNVVNKYGKRNYSIDAVKKGTFTELKSPYEWDSKPAPPIKHSFISVSRDTSPKVNNSSFDAKIYKENAANNDPISKGHDIA